MYKLEYFQKLAETLIESGEYGDKNEQRVARITVILLCGAELGVDPLRALSEIKPITRKRTIHSTTPLSAEHALPDGDFDFGSTTQFAISFPLLLDLIKHSPYTVMTDTVNDDEAAITILDNRQKIGSVKYDKNDAERHGWLDRPIYLEDPKRIHLAEAVARATTFYMPLLRVRGPIYLPVIAVESGRPAHRDQLLRSVGHYDLLTGIGNDFEAVVQYEDID